MSDVKILALVGSLRAASVNRQIAELAVEAAPGGVAVTVYDGLGDVPFYNEDLDTSALAVDRDHPASVLRAAVSDADALLLVTPEYNGTIPGVLKNAIDWLSRPYGDGALKDKPLAVIGAAGGRHAGVWSHDETRKTSGIAGARVDESITLSLPLSALDGRPPREVPEVAGGVGDVVKKLAADVA